ncbi:MAG: hypothetical protein ACR2KX_18430 [Chitinophagaceae bacterium]
MDSKTIISDFLQNQPLYSKIEIDKQYYHPDRFYQLTFPFYCPNETSLQTFMLILEPEKVITAMESIASDRFQDLFDPYQKGKSIKFIHHFSGQCQYCKKYKVDFLLNIFSDGPIPGLMLSIGHARLKVLQDGVHQDDNMEKFPDHKLFIRKIGQFPPFEINPEKEIINFFEETDKEFYKKSLICLSQSFGVGAYAYLRRITENEILRIVEALSQIETDDGEKIKALYYTYKANKQMSNLIEGVYTHLPASLRALGVNPLKVLYGHLSEGIHADSEDICLKKAFQIDTILRFTIKKLNEEKHELKEIRNALKDLGH